MDDQQLDQQQQQQQEDADERRLLLLKRSVRRADSFQLYKHMCFPAFRQLVVMTL